MDVEKTIFESLPHGGAVVALIVVVTVFLKRQEKSDETLKDVATLFATEVSESRKAYLASLESLFRFIKGGKQ